MAKQGGLPGIPGDGPQVPFQSGQPSAALPGSTTPVSLPGSPVGGAPDGPGKTERPGEPKRKRRHWRRWVTLAHVSIAVGGLIGIARANRGADALHVRLPKIAPVNLHPTTPGETPASATLKLVASSGAVRNGVYRATGSAIQGAATSTQFEFAVNGRGAQQRVVYIAGLRIRDASCDGRPAASRLYGLALYNDEVAAKGTRVRGSAVTAAFKDGEESLRATARSGATIAGTFSFGGYTSCEAGGHFQFTATRDPSGQPRLATVINRLGG